LLSVSNASLSISISPTFCYCPTLHRSMINAALHNCTDDTGANVVALSQTITNFRATDHALDFLPGNKRPRHIPLETSCLAGELLYPKSSAPMEDRKDSAL